MSTERSSTLFNIVLAVAIMFVISTPVLAGTGGAEFTDVYDWFTGLIQGTGGRLLGVLALIGAVALTAVTLRVGGIGGLLFVVIAAAFGVAFVNSMITAVVSSAMSDESHIIPKHLDDPPMYLMWDADEAYAFLGPVFIVVALSPSLTNFLIGRMLGYFTSRTLARIKSAGGRQLIKHALYWYTPTNAWFKLRRTPGSDVREFVG